MKEVSHTEIKSSAFHIHLDAALLPASLESYVKSQYGFFDDDFEHELIAGRQSRPARQLTLKITDRLARSVVQKICEDIQARAEIEGFEGLIQSEYVMNESVITKAALGSASISTLEIRALPFHLYMRPVNPALGEAFKSHELHLEFLAAETSNALIQELSRSGMQVSLGSEITFTAAGTLNDIRQIQKELINYLNKSAGFVRAKLIVEATVFHSLHQMREEDTPFLVDRIEYFH